MTEDQAANDKAPPSVSEASPAQPEKSEKKEKTWFDAIKEGNEEDIKRGAARHIRTILKKHGIEEKYETLFLFDNHYSINDLDSDRLYSASHNTDKDILLILQSGGGKIEPAYLISKSLKHFSKSRFVVAVPRRAKSAATLICLGADEIHMGITSQLGPIDPQINGLPALGLVNALDTLAGLASRFPDASKMLSSYLESKLDLGVLGYFNRVTESAVQYGERLLANKSLPSGNTAQKVADHLVNHYKDHGFVIDISEATELLGTNLVKVDTPEYRASSEIYQFFDFFEFVLSRNLSKQFYYLGNIDSGLTLFTPKNS